MGLPREGQITAKSTVFLPGKTSHGHHQIEMNCSVCHLPDGGVTDQSCIDCHSKELKESRDTHPRSRFLDPTKAPLLRKIDAKNCLSCHVEHQEELTGPMGVTVPEDYCWHCHQDIAEDRPSHRDFAFNSCANAGCHNYHDNTALYENFLKKHAGEATVLSEPKNPLRRFQQWLANSANTDDPRLLAADSDAPAEWNDAEAVGEWSGSTHAAVGVNCSGCHSVTEESNSDAAGDWSEVPGHVDCEKCHRNEVGSFLNGRHGMRMASGLPPMTPELARLPMHSAADHKVLNCSACHDAHDPDPNFAAVDACLSCHDDGHSRAYLQSSHFEAWQAEVAGEASAGSGVSCATCHMPRDEDGSVQHNQNRNLRPNEKMARTVCMNCHGLQFTLDALADPQLKANCYSSRPEATVRSLQMVKDWFESKKK